MKKTLAIILALCMVFALCACGAKTEAPAAAPAEAAPVEAAPAEATPEAAPVEETPAAEPVEYALGMGVNVSTHSTAEANAQVDATFAAVILDAEGKIVMCRIDCAQNKMDVSSGVVDVEKAFLTKVELGDNYNMVKFGNSIAEWDAQAAAFEQYVVGMTGEEVAALETVVNESGHNVSTDDVLLAGCTIDITAFKAAVAKACADDQAVKFVGENFKLGVAAISTAEESVQADAENDGSVRMYTEFGAAVVGEDGAILAALNDAIQPKIAYTAKGEVGEVTFAATKRELKEDYNMVKYGNAVAEWYVQSAAFSAYTAGLTADQVAGLETVINDEGHQVTVDADLFATCTMSIGGMMAVIAQAANYAR